MVTKILFSLIFIAATGWVIMMPRDAFDLGDEETPVTELRVGFVPSHEDPERVLTSFEALRGYLEKELGMPVRLRETSSYAPAVEAMRSRKLDVCYLPPFAYLIASERAGAQAIVVRGTVEDGPGAYTTLLITHPNTGLRSVDDVIERGSELIFSFVDPASTSGHLIPRAFLESHGIRPEQHFSRVIFAMNHGASVLTVRGRRVDVAAVSVNAYNRLMENGRISEENVRVIWESPKIPSGAIAVRGGLSEELRMRIQSAFVDLPVRAPEVWAVVSGQYADRDLVYLPGEDEMYNELRSIARNVEHMRLIR